MAGDKKEVNIHIVHSMKGGCGKSTCALFKTLQIACKQDENDKKAHVLYLDADFKGSAMAKILFREGGSADGEVTFKNERLSRVLGLAGGGGTVVKGLQYRLAVPDNYNPDKTLSNYLKDNSQLFMRDIIYQSCLYYKEDKSGMEELDETSVGRKEIYINGYVDFILSSAASKSKDWFRYRPGKIAAGIYGVRMEALLHNILNHGKINRRRRGSYSDIVIDMPPGYDEYSDILLDILRGIAEKEESIRLHYYGVTTEDLGHRALTEDNVKKMMPDAEKYKPLSSVNLVLSEVSSTDFSVITPDEINNFKKWVEQTGNEDGKVYKNEYSEPYHNFCRKEEESGFAVDITNVLQEIT